MPSISVNAEIKARLDELKSLWTTEAARRVTWNEVCQRLLDEHARFQRVEGQVSHLHEVIEQALLHKREGAGRGGGAASGPPPAFSPPPGPPGGEARPSSKPKRKPRPPGPPAAPDPAARAVTGTRAELMAEFRRVFSEGVRLKPVSEGIAEEIGGDLVDPRKILRILEAVEDDALAVDMMENILMLARELEARETSAHAIDHAAEVRRIRTELADRKRDEAWRQHMEEASAIVRRIQEDLRKASTAGH